MSYCCLRYPGQVSRLIPLDSCDMQMVEGVVKDSQGAGFIGVGWKLPTGSKSLPIGLSEIFWMLPGRTSGRNSICTFGSSCHVILVLSLICYILLLLIPLVVIMDVTFASVQSIFLFP